MTVKIKALAFFHYISWFYCLYLLVDWCILGLSLCSEVSFVCFFACFLLFLKLWKILHDVCSYAQWQESFEACQVQKSWDIQELFLSHQMGWAVSDFDYFFNYFCQIFLTTGLWHIRTVILINLGAFSLFRINFPISVALLPLETILSLSLYGVLNQNSSNSPDSNKLHKGPELLGKVTMPLFDFRR